ncbi:DAK2 domain-containing protein [Actinocrinis puniceicyclus]|uniref:DAK2 domain-containing protein n=1 Tax=Actinocrinis puniceicyclus TaxID=977794 RepID=A0A8J7WI11_9ACTN|nr:DAK2 domain-containing protein [Actinocrinis puniceicyclus]MBS2961683.1 DAK2 domain-containing protein [Actinocrinis puniceicyclus]
MLETLDGPAVRLWARACLAALGRAREEIDALNVFPVPDADTGTNLFLTFEAACEALDALDPPPEADGLGAATALGALAGGALKAAHGNSGVILSQLLRGLADEVGAAIRDGQPAGPRVLAAALADAAELAWQAVAAPVEGTMLTVARAAADAACAVVDGTDLHGDWNLEPTFAAVAQAARDAAESALAHTPEQLPALSAAGVVDAGGRGICILLDVLSALLGGYDPMRAVTVGRVRVPPQTMTAIRDNTVRAAKSSDPPTIPSFEVVYMVDTNEPQLRQLRATLEEFCEQGGGDSLVIAGGAGSYRVHIHVERPGPVIEAAIRLGRPHDLHVNALSERAVRAPREEAPLRLSGRIGADHADVAHGGGPLHFHAAPGRVVLAAAPGPGLAELFAAAGATPLPCAAGRPPTSAQLSRAIAQAGVEEVVVLVNDADGLAAASAAAEQVHRGTSGVRVAVVPSKAVVQGIAALAVHEPGRRFDADIVAMTAAAGATRHGALQVAEDDAWTMAGVCHAGDVLGFIEGDVALIAPTLRDAALALVDRMVSAGGEMVTLVTGDGFGSDGDPDGTRLADAVRARVQATRPEMDVVAYEGGQSGWPLLIGVE